MSDIKNILAATDFSDMADRAIDTAVALAKQLKAKLHIVHIVQIHPVNMPESGSLNVEELELTEEKAANQKLETCARERCADIELSSYVLHGDPAGQVRHMAEQTSADFIVMGTHGRTGISHLIMGSVAESVLKNSDIPVMCVKAR